MSVITEKNEPPKKPISTLNGKRGEFWKYMQVQKQFDDIEYWVHLQERLNHLAYCMHSVHMVTSVAFGDLSRLTHATFFSKIEPKLELESE